MLHHANRRRWIQGTATALGTAAVAPRLLAQGAPVRVGYAMSRTGPWTGGAQVSQEPNYILWAEQQNAAGGLDVKGVPNAHRAGRARRPQRDRDLVRTYEKLMGSDKVDLILPPWGSNANFAVAPLANRFGYPMLAPTALSRKLIDMNLPYFFSLLQQPDRMMGALVDMLVANNVKTIAIVYMDDLFGLENFAALNNALKKTSIQVVDRKSYPLGVKDLSPVLRAMKDLNPDAFIGITYPPDTILASRQAQGSGLQPEVSSTPRSAPPSSSTRT
jgi:branched-chain amino acid transport system substrate-binding protein